MKRNKAKITSYTIIVLLVLVSIFVLLRTLYRKDDRPDNSMSTTYYDNDEIRKIFDNFMLENSNTQITLNGQLTSTIIRVESSAMQTYIVSESSTIVIMLPDINKQDAYIKDTKGTWYYLLADEDINFNSLTSPISEIDINHSSFLVNKVEQNKNKNKVLSISSKEQEAIIEINDSDRLEQAIVKSNYGDIIYEFDYENNYPKINLPTSYEDINSTKYQKVIDIFAPLINIENN